MAMAYAFYAEIMRALAGSPLAPILVRGQTPVAELKPGDEADIIFDIDQEQEPRWQRLVLSPSPAEPPTWSVRLESEAADDRIASESGLQLAEALSAVAERMTAG